MQSQVSHKSHTNTVPSNPPQRADVDYDLDGPVPRLGVQELEVREDGVRQDRRAVKGQAEK